MRYITLRPKLSYEEQEPMLPSLTVYESQKQPKPTGLVDQHGMSIYRIPETIKMGFE